MTALSGPNHESHEFHEGHRLFVSFVQVVVREAA